MSYESRQPSIRLKIDAGSFNLMLSALAENGDNEYSPEEVVTRADALFDKLLKYSRPYVDELETDCVEIRFFPNEASEMIWQLLLISSPHVELTDDFYLRLKESHIPKDKKK